MVTRSNRLEPRSPVASQPTRGSVIVELASGKKAPVARTARLDQTDRFDAAPSSPTGMAEDYARCIGGGGGFKRWPPGS